MLTIYKASAGSGKTFTLAYEYIKLLLGRKDENGQYRLDTSSKGEKHRSILAVTFTNKATEEMKQRILHQLAILAGMEPGWNEPSPYLSRLCEELKTSPSEIKSASEKALKGLLTDFNFFNVSTIDAFFQVVLRTFAREAELTGNYELELDDNRAIEYGVTELFAWLNSNDKSSDARHVTEWVTKYLIEKLNQGKSITLFNRASQVHANFTGLISDITNDTLTIHYKELMGYLRDTPEKLRYFNQALTQGAKELTDEIARKCAYALNVIEREDNLYPGHIKKDLHKALEKFAANPGLVAYSPSTIPPKVVDDISAAYVTARNKYRESAPTELLDSAILDACRALTGNAADINLYELIRNNLFILGLLDRVYRYVEQFREENNTILLSDTNGLLREIIGDDDAPFVYERVGLWLKHFLIDEFQDTSRLQWSNLRPLLNESMASDSDSLIIGDEKQCIYRFRDSDPTLLGNQVQQQFAGRTNVMGNIPEHNVNRRSAKHIVDFNNNLFEWLAQRLNQSCTYANVHQQLPGQNTYNGYVSVKKLATEQPEEFESQALARMAAEMERELAAGFGYSDICVLTRNKKDAEKVIKHLLDINATAGKTDCMYPMLSKANVISDDAMLISASPAVKTVISTLRAISLPRTSSGKTPDTGHISLKTRKQLIELINRHEHFSSTGRSASQALQMALDNESEAWSPEYGISATECSNLPSMVEHIINTCISEHERDKQNMYISALQDLICDYCANSTPHIPEFLKWWDSYAAHTTVSAPMDSQAIRVMTIHKSKGLESKCIHIPMLNYKVVKFKSHQWFRSKPLPGISPDLMPPLVPMIPGNKLKGTPFELQYNAIVDELLLDELNVLYVAFTRASEELIVSYRPSNSDTDIGKWLAMAQQALPEYGTIDGMANGTPLSSPAPAKEKKRTALVPHGSVDMMPYRVNDGKYLWEQTRVDYDSDRAAAIRRGVAMHDILAMVKHVETLHSAVERAVRKHLVPRAEAAGAESLLRDRINRADCLRWFSGYKRILCERTITKSNGTHSRPDRVVWTSDGYIDIIDYKFGGENTSAYAAQVREYICEFKAMGYENVRGYVWYVDSGKTVPVKA